MARYRKKPVIVEAVRWTGENYREVRAFVGGQAGSPIEDADSKLHIWNTQEHQLILCPVGHWVIKGIAGEFYPCSPIVFDTTYEKVV